MQTSLEIAMDDRRRRDIEAVTDNFFFWQGLRFAPLGAALLVSLLLPSRVERDVRVLLMVAVMAVAFIVSGMAGRYYDRTFGKVHGIPGRHARREAWKWWFVYPLMLASLLADVMLDLPIFLSGPVWGAAIVAYWNSTGRGRLHYLIFATALASMAFFPMYSVVDGGKQSIRLFFASIGAAYVIGGVLDHFELTRILRPIPEDGNGRTV